MSANLLELDDVGIRFGGLQAVAGLSFGVGHGEVVGLIGPNGAGKTTAFNMITGVYRPTTGEIRFDGHRISGRPAHQIAARGVARTFQTIRLFQGHSVVQNVQAGTHLHVRQRWWQGLLGVPEQRREERRLRDESMLLLKELNLEKYAEQDAGSLPYGVQRRVELARALMTRPKLLILDEPAAGLNDAESKELNQTIRSIQSRGISVLLVEHDMSVVMNVTNRVVCINFGRKIAEGVPEAVATDEAVVEAYLGRDEEL